MASKKGPVLPPSPEAQAALFVAIRLSTEPLLAKALVAQLAPPHPVTEAQLLPVLEDAVRAGSLRKYPAATAKGKPRYWDRDLLEVTRQVLHTAALQADAPFTAKELARVKSPVKLSEVELTALLNDLVTQGTLHLIPSKTAKGQPRYWRQDLLEFGRRTVLQVIDRQGPQAVAALKKQLPGLTEPQLQQVLHDLQTAGTLLRHPPLGTSKHELLGTQPPAATPYLKEIGKQLVKVVTLLTAAHVSQDDLRRSLVQLIEAAGIPFGLAASPLPSSPIDPASVPSDQVATVDLVALMKQIEPAAERGALIGARELRRSAHLPKAVFDRAVLSLAQTGKLSLHRHDFAASLSPTERDELVTDGEGTYYVGMALRSS